LNYYKDALSAGCVSLPRNPQISTDFVIDMNVINQAFTVPETFKNGNNVALVADDGFTAVKSHLFYQKNTRSELLIQT
jgi:hypothetical protein